VFALPSALEPRSDLALAFRRSFPRSLDRVGGRTELVRRNMCDGCRLARGVGGMPWCPSQISGRGVRVAGRDASLGHPDLSAHPRADLLDRLTRTRIVGPSGLEEVEDVLGARCRPQGQAVVVRISERPTAANRHEARVALLREDHRLVSPRASI